MLIYDVRGNEYHINLSQVVCARIYDDGSYPTEHRVEMTNCDYICVSEDEYERIVAYLDKRDYLTAVDSSRQGDR